MRTDIENCWSWLRRMIRSNAPRIAHPTVRERLYNTYTPLWASKAIGSLAENTRWNSSFSERLGVNEWSSVVWKWHQFVIQYTASALSAQSKRLQLSARWQRLFVLEGFLQHLTGLAVLSPHFGQPTTAHALTASLTGSHCNT